MSNPVPNSEQERQAMLAEARQNKATIEQKFATTQPRSAEECHSRKLQLDNVNRRIDNLESLTFE